MPSRSTARRQFGQRCKSARFQRRASRSRDRLHCELPDPARARSCGTSVCYGREFSGSRWPCLRRCATAAPGLAGAYRYRSTPILARSRHAPGSTAWHPLGALVLHGHAATPSIRVFATRCRADRSWPAGAPATRYTRDLILGGRVSVRRSSRLIVGKPSPSARGTRSSNPVRSSGESANQFRWVFATATSST